MKNPGNLKAHLVLRPGICQVQQQRIFNNSFLMVDKTLYIKNARGCLTMISKHERAYEAREAKPRELYMTFKCFDIMGKHERKFL